MIISQTPFRVSFFGGGTDYPAWYREHGGQVLTTTINKYCYISCRILPPFFQHKHRIVYSSIEMVQNIDEIKHPSVKACMKYLGIEDGLEIHHDGDLPARSGIGSSSAFTVGFLNTLYALKGRMVSKQDLAAQAIHVEQNIIGETVGSQDQIAAAYGGMNKIEFHKDDSFSVYPAVVQKERKDALEKSLLMFFTGLSRTAETVAKTKVANFKQRETHLKTMGSFVDDALGILQNPSRDISDFGKLLHENWKLKKELSGSVSNAQIDEVYQAGMEAGALGGKILGAGGGGFVLLFAKPENHSAIRRRLSKLIEVNINFENQGSRVVLYDPYFGNQNVSAAL